MTHWDVVTVTLNPALDLATSASGVKPGPKLRCAAPRIDPGGGGINVSRAIRILGGQSLPVVALGGATGQAIADLMDAEGLTPHLLRSPGETRQSFAVTDSQTGHQFRFLMPGPKWGDQDVEEALSHCMRIAASARWVVLSGSQPPGVSDRFPNVLAQRLQSTAARLVVDTSGEALQALATDVHDGAKPALLRFDQAEASALAGERLGSPAATGDFAARLVARGIAEAVIVACGSDGSVLATPQAVTYCKPPKVPVVSRIGAGDSFVAACVLSLLRGAELADALRYGTAAAAAAVMTPATRLCTADDAQRLLNDCEVRVLRRNA